MLYQIAPKISFNFARCFGILIFLCLFNQIIFGQKNDDEVIKVETDLVTFEVNVTDKNGKPIRGLEPKDFKIFEDGIEREASFFEQLHKTDEKRPLAVVFALDISGSMKPEEFAKLRAAMSVFISRLANYESYFSVLAFGMENKVLQSFTNDPKKLEKALVKLEREPNGLSTHTYDAVDDAIRMIQRKTPKTLNQQTLKRAVIVVTDGFPVGDTVAPKTVIERANNSETTVYSVILPSYSRLQPNKNPLPTLLDVSGLTEKTGGKNFYATDKNFDELFRALAEEITSSYLLAFYPDEEKRLDGKNHTVRIETKKDFVLRQNRTGYQLKKEN